MGGIANDDHLALGPGLDGGAVEERPALDLGGFAGGESIGVATRVWGGDTNLRTARREG